MPLMLPRASHWTRISLTSATTILLRPIDHLRLRCGYGRGHLLRTGRWQIVVNRYLVNSDEQNRPHPGKLRRTATVRAPKRTSGQRSQSTKADVRAPEVGSRVHVEKRLRLVPR